MSRIARVVAVGLPHHITQKGNYGQNVFLDANDRTRYLVWIQEYSLKYGVSILAYCLMGNHVHFIAVPDREDSLAKTFNTAHMRYSQYLNKKLGRNGHLWQGRFYSCILDEPHLMLAARYIERNPVRAGIAEKPWQWIWSSAIDHTSERERGSLIRLGDFFKITDMSYGSWRKYIDCIDQNNFLQEIRSYTLTGRPLGRVEFIERLQQDSGRILSALPIGRPKRK